MSDANAKQSTTKEDIQYGKYLTFILGKEIFGIEIKYVTEIIGMQVITEVPELPFFVMGIINLRGKIIPVIDVRLKFKKEQIAYDDRTCIVVIDIDDSPIGLIVDNVAEVISLADGDIALPPGNKTGFENNYIKGIVKSGIDVILILEGPKLLQSENIGIPE